MKIFSSQQIYEADKKTLERQQISGDALMERAAVQIFNWIHSRMNGAPARIHLFCGVGNNGGDGLATARHLHEHGYNVSVHVVDYSSNRSEEFLLNLDRLKERKLWPDVIGKETPMPEIDSEDIIVDAIFGIGLNREPDPWVANVIDHINQSGAFVISVDLPSGLYMERAVENPSAVIEANYVLSIQLPKLIFFLPDTGVYSNQWEVLDIGMDDTFLQQTDCSYRLIGKNDILGWYQPRERFSHKGTFGHALIAGGSYGKIGAVQLASRACIRAGAGLVTAYVPGCGYVPMQSALPEVMLLTDPDEHKLTEISFQEKINVVGLGIGMGKDPESQKALGSFLKKYKDALVIDADGLNILSENTHYLSLLQPGTILTPHPGELARLIGKWEDDFEKLDKIMAFVEEYDCVLVLKGAHTITFYKGKGYINITGNPGMASAGSGDVLTGIITGLRAQGYDALPAALMGVYLHGRAADLVVEKTGYQALIATDIIDGLGAAYLDLFELPGAAESEE